MTKPFSELQVDDLFTCNGNSWIKRSTRTARGFSSDNYGKVIYFSKSERVDAICW
jgi:hypothetical protein